MDGNCMNSGDLKGKVKANSTSEDFQEHIPYPDKAKFIFEEGKGPEDNNSEEELIVENLSSNAEENMPNQDQAFPDPHDDHVVDPAGANDPSSPRVTEIEHQCSPVAFPDLGGDHMVERSPVNVPSPPRVTKEDKGSPVALPDPSGDHVAEPEDVNIPSPLENEDQGSPLGFPDPSGENVAKLSPVHVPSPPRVAEADDQGSPVVFPNPGGDHVTEQTIVNIPIPPQVGEKEDQGSSMAFPDPGSARVAFPEPDDDHVAEVVAVNIPPAPPRVGREEDAQEHTAYSCRHCDLLFPSAQALGGHQNGHRHMREYAKRLKRNEELPLCYYNLGNTRLNYGDNPNGDNPNSANGYPQVTLNNGNMFFFPRTPLGNPFSRPVVPTIQNPRSTTEFTVGQSGQSSSMFNSTQLPVYGRPGMIYPYSGNYGNSNHTTGNFNSLETVGGRQGGMLEGFGAPTINSNSIGSAYNSMGTVGGSGSVSTNVGLLRPYENSRIFAGGFDAAGTSAGISRNIFELAVGGRSYNESQDTFRGRDGSDCTIDLLSRVGTGSGEDAETDTDSGNEETES